MELAKDKTIYNGVLHVRGGTYDQVIFQSVYVENEYQINNFEDKIVVDIGAHIGSFSMLAAQSGAKKVLAFEANKGNFRLLKSNLQSTFVEVYNLAVYDSDGSNFQSIPSYDAANTGGCPVGKIEKGGVLSISLDIIISMAGFIDVLKLDCEGSEYPIILGCENLKKIKAIVGEYHSPNQCPFDDFKNKLLNNGFHFGSTPTSDMTGHFHAIRI